MPRLPSIFIILCSGTAVNPRASRAVLARCGRRGRSRYNLAMDLRIAFRPMLLAWMLSLTVALAPFAACTFYSQHPARTYEDATGGEGLELVFWKNVAAGNWTQVERALASNYVGVTPGGTLDHAAALAQYQQWSVKDYSLGDLKTELNGTTIVVTYTIALKGTSGSQPLPAGPQHRMTVWQRQKTGWIIIAQSVSRP
jgi:Domain of unknown function (DUF4440)